MGFTESTLVLGRRLGALAATAVMAAAFMGLMTGEVANASSPARSHQPPVVRPRFRYVGAGSWIWTGARYALAGPGVPLPGLVSYTTATLIDDQTGQVKTIGRAGCSPVKPSALEPLDLPWVPFNCGSLGESAPELYSPATGQWLAVSPSPGVSPVCGGGGCPVSYFLAAAGRYWLEYTKEACSDHCGPSRNVFQNLQTGELRQDPSGGRTAVDLNAPNLTRTVCRPLTLPTTFVPHGPGPVPGLLTFYRRFALASGGDATGGVAYLERCGTHLHRLLSTGPAPWAILLPAANTSEVVWMAHPRPSLSALTLPGLQPFTIALPQRLIDARACSLSLGDLRNCVGQIALTNRRLYILTASLPVQLWVAPDQLPPKRHH